MCMGMDVNMTTSNGRGGLGRSGSEEDYTDERAEPSCHVGKVRDSASVVKTAWTAIEHRIIES